MSGSDANSEGTRAPLDNYKDIPVNTIVAFYTLTRTESVRYKLSEMVLGVAVWLHSILVPGKLQKAAKEDSRHVTHKLEFERQTDRSGNNVYVFQTENGRRIGLSPGATVSELQNRL